MADLQSSTVMPDSAVGVVRSEYTAAKAGFQQVMKDHLLSVLNPTESGSDGTLPPGTDMSIIEEVVFKV